MTMIRPSQRALLTVLLGAGLACGAADAEAAGSTKAKKPPQVQQDPMETENSPPPVVTPTETAPADKPGSDRDGGSGAARPNRPAGGGSSTSSSGSSNSGAGSDAGNFPEKAGFFMFNVKLGPALCAYPSGCAHQGAAVLDLGAALTTNRNGYLILPIQFQFQPGASAIMVPIGFQYDIRLPKRGLYLYPRISAGYAAILTNVPSGGMPNTVLHSGIILAEFGIKYVVRGRWNLGGEFVSLPLFLNSNGAQLYYRVQLSAGVNF